MSPTEAIISIYPEHAHAILAGRKTIELRRRVPALSLGMRLWIYATRPTGAVVGFVTIQEIVRARPQAIWERHSEAAAIDYSTFVDYFDGTEDATAILLAAARTVDPITVEQLRTIRSSFHPPQVLTLLSAVEAEALRKIANIS